VKRIVAKMKSAKNAVPSAAVCGEWAQALGLPKGKESAGERLRAWLAGFRSQGEDRAAKWMFPSVSDVDAFLSECAPAGMKLRPRKANTATSYMVALPPHTGQAGWMDMATPLAAQPLGIREHAEVARHWSDPVAVHNDPTSPGYAHSSCAVCAVCAVMMSCAVCAVCACYAMQVRRRADGEGDPSAVQRHLPAAAAGGRPAAHCGAGDEEGEVPAGRPA
jgi:hypothetical protein